MYDDVIGVGPVAGDVGGGDEAAESAALVGEVSEVGEAEGGREGLGAVALFAFGDEDGECGCAAPFLAAFAQSVEFDVGGRRARCRGYDDAHDVAHAGRLNQVPSRFGGARIRARRSLRRVR